MEILSKAVSKLTDEEMEALVSYTMTELNSGLAGYIVAFRENGTVSVNKACTAEVKEYPSFIDFLKNTMVPA